MDFFFFNEPAYRYGVTTDAKSSLCRHRAGGPPRHKGIKDPVTGRSAIPVFEFDLTDPYLGIRIPGITRLTCHYTFCANIGGYAYRVVSDDAVELILPQKDRSPLDAAELKHAARFDKKYKKGLPAMNWAIAWFKYNCLDPDDYELRNIFPRQELEREEERELLRALNALHQDILITPARSLEETDEELPDLTFPVGSPQDYCPNPKCRKGKKNLMKLLLIMQPDEEEEPLYSSMAGGDAGVLSFTWCVYCYTIRVINQCT